MYFLVLLGLLSTTVYSLPTPDKLENDVPKLPSPAQDRPFVFHFIEIKPHLEINSVDITISPDEFNALSLPDTLPENFLKELLKAKEEKPNEVKRIKRSPSDEASENPANAEQPKDPQPNGESSDSNNSKEIKESSKEENKETSTEKGSGEKESAEKEGGEKESGEKEGGEKESGEKESGEKEIAEKDGEEKEPSLLSTFLSYFQFFENFIPNWKPKSPLGKQRSYYIIALDPEFEE